MHALGAHHGPHACLLRRKSVSPHCASPLHPPPFTSPPLSPHSSIVHPRFSPGSFDADVAALILDTPSAHAPVALVGRGMRLGAPAPSWTSSEGGSSSDSGAAVMAQAAGGAATPNDEHLAGGAMFWAAGWGATETGRLSDTLLEAEVTPINHGDCVEAFVPYGTRITRRMVCVAGGCGGGAGTVSE